MRQCSLQYIPRNLESIISFFHRTSQSGTAADGSPASSARKLAHQLRQSTSEGTLPDSYQGDSGTVAICAFKVHCILSVDNTAVAEQDSGILIIFTFYEYKIKYFSQTQVNK